MSFDVPTISIDYPLTCTEGLKFIVHWAYLNVGYVHKLITKYDIYNNKNALVLNIYTNVVCTMM